MAGTIGAWATVNATGSSSNVRSQTCHSEVICEGRSDRAIGWMITPKIRLPSSLALRNSAKQYFESRQAGETRKSTASHRSTACISAATQRSPGIMPRVLSMSR